MLKKILIIDNVNTDKLTDLLKGTYDILVASTRGEAINRIREERKSLSLILINPMIDPSGLEFITEVYELNPRDVIPIVAIFSEEMKEYISQVWKFGIADCIREPFVGEIIRVRLRNLINLYEMKNRILMDDLVRNSKPATLGKAVEILEYEASHDGLTDILNQTYAKREVAFKITHDPMANYAMVILDLDHFKEANDMYGHLFGDEILRQFADRMKACIRRNDIISRVGGDEFLLLIRYKVNIETAIDRIFNSLVGEYKGIRISFSMGIARTETEGTDFEKLFDCADKALYAAKKAGRGCYRFYDESMKDTLSAISPIDK